MEPSSPQPPAPSRLQLVPWAVLPIALLPLLLLLASSPDSGLVRAAIKAGQSFRTISVARLFEGGNPAPSAVTLAVLDWQSLIGIGLFAVGLLAIVAWFFRARDLKQIAETVIGLLILLILPAVSGLLLIGPVWDGYEMPTRHTDMAHIMLAAGGWIVGQVSIGMAVVLWTAPPDRPWRRAGEASPNPVIRRGRMSKVLLGTGGVETCLQLLPILLALGAWAVLRFHSVLPDRLLFVFIDGGAIVYPFTLPVLIGWLPQAFPGLDPLQIAMVLAFRDWQGFALTVAICCGVVLLVLESRRTPPEHRLMGSAKSLFMLGLSVGFFYWFLGDIWRPAVDPTSWQPEIATVMTLVMILASMAGNKSKPKQDGAKEEML
jgi:hypothetical protein